MKWLTIITAPLLLTCFCFISQKSQDDCNIGRLKSYPINILQTGNMSKDNNTGQSSFHDRHAVISNLDLEKTLNNKNLIVWVL